MAGTIFVFCVLCILCIVYCILYMYIVYCILYMYIVYCILYIYIVYCILHILYIVPNHLGTKRTHPGGRADRIFMLLTLPPPPSSACKISSSDLVIEYVGWLSGLVTKTTLSSIHLMMISLNVRIDSFSAPFNGLPCNFV